jgi:hypothetical protein
MFAWKSMDASSSLTKLKLEMVYRDLSTDSAAQMFDEIVRPKIPETVEEPAEIPVAVVQKPKKKKVVKAVLPKS